MLDLHEESGLAAIRACGLYEVFFTFTGDCEESMIVADKQGNILHTDKGEAASRPEIARHNIVKLFLSVISGGLDQIWHKSCLGYTKPEERRGHSGAPVHRGKGNNYLGGLRPRHWCGRSMVQGSADIKP